MLTTRCIRPLRFVILLGSGLFLCSTAQAVTQTAYKQCEIRKNARSRMCFLVAPIPTINNYYNNDEDCGQGHKTVNGGRFFSHGHIVTYTFPADAVDDTGAMIQVATADIREYWEWNNGGQYFSYDHSGNEDVTYNCWGYALGPAVWIQDPSYIYADDYQACGAEAGAVIPVGNSHVIKIEQICNNGDAGLNTVGKTSEKNRCSRIESMTYYCPGGGPWPVNTPFAMKKK